MRAEPDRTAVLCVALAWGLCVAVAAYGVIRGIQFFVYPDPNPKTLVWSAHAGFFWRCWTCVYGGGIATFVALLAARRDLAASARILVSAVAVAAAVLSLQVGLLP